MTGWMVLVAGAMVGLGVATIATALVPNRPSLRAALSRLDAGPQETFPAPGATPTGKFVVPARVGAVQDRYLPRIAEALGLQRFVADLRVVGWTPEDLALRKIGYAALGVAFPTVFALLLAVAGVQVPLAAPTVVAVVLGAALFFVPELDVRRRAHEEREDMRRAACVYLELVALERAADAGTTEALDRAASIGDSRSFTRIREALLRAELSRMPAWYGLSELSDAMGVPELGDLADIMHLSGADGAAVYATLRARAASLRTQLLTSATAKANAASEHMVVPVALLGVAFMALVGYPAFIRILIG